MEDALSSIWNEDGTPKRPEPDQGAEHAFADFAFNTGDNQELFLSYGNARAKILRLTSASIGDIVHYWTGVACRAAIVTAVPETSPAETLHVFQPGEHDGEVAAVHDEDKNTGTWHWAESA
jgi:hypothetical protein